MFLIGGMGSNHLTVVVAAGQYSTTEPQRYSSASDQWMLGMQRLRVGHLDDYFIDPESTS